ncbi:MAG: lipoyl(octanoyl) transferase LipB [Acidobacteria bacterium]|nr:lipoyl(octanoyl) transferase LipB [Acidobacteriota bacterium]
MRRRCEARRLGRVAYPEATRLQESLVRDLAAGTGGEALLLLEHPHVVTLGRGADGSNVLLDEGTRAARGIGVHGTGRGGDVTYHGPGQLVGYPVIDLRPDRCDVHRYVRDLEEVLIRAARDFGVDSARVEGRTGVWAGGRKLAAIGVRVSRWITSHGFAFNVTTDLSYFGHIVPCGITDAGVTSLRELTGESFGLDAVARACARHFGEVFDREVVAADAGGLAAPPASLAAAASGGR